MKVKVLLAAAVLGLSISQVNAANIDELLPNEKIQWKFFRNFRPKLFTYIA